jgi:hypothetical protein
MNISHIISNMADASPPEEGNRYFDFQWDKAVDIITRLNIAPQQGRGWFGAN